MASSRRILIAVGTMLATAAAHADTGMYVGAGVGRSNVSDIYHTAGEVSGSGGFYHIDNATAWKAILGWRPVSPFALEANYIDLGTDTYHWNNGQVSFSARATTLYGVGFLPLPFPNWDVYGKAGAARWELDGKRYFLPGTRTDEAAQFAWGGGCNSITLALAFGSSMSASKSRRRGKRISTLRG